MANRTRNDRLVELFFLPGPRVLESARGWLAAEEKAGRRSWPDVRPVLELSAADVLDEISETYGRGHPGGLWQFVDDFYANQLPVAAKFREVA